MSTLYWILIISQVVIATLVAGHALLNKRDPRAALGWVAVCLTFPIAGPILYGLFGINRVRRSAARLREEAALYENDHAALHGGDAEESPPGAISDYHIPPRYKDLERVGRRVTGRSLVGGNAVEPLYNGEMAFPAMLAAIEQATTSVYLTTYLLETGSVGRDFIATLNSARKRGVDVRVIIDGVGEKYSWPRASKLLRKAGVSVAIFLPPRLVPPQISINLRNHRKILVVDGHIGFTGGMNIGRRHLVETRNPRCVTDIHFSVQGPIVAQLQEAFLLDWGYVTGEYEAPDVTVNEVGDSLCRMVLDGPDNPEDPLSSALMGVVSTARRTIRIMTPYFLPSREFLASLNAAAIRGVDVRIILPARNNLPVVHWATRNLLWELLQQGIRIFYQPAPFCHSKLCIVDGSYVHLGSANLDPRSLRLNFELTLEVFDIQLARQLCRHFESKQRESHEITLDEVDSRSLLAKLRDAFCWLFSPYM